jgi:hypothetical protein
MIALAASALGAAAPAREAATVRIRTRQRAGESGIRQKPMMIRKGERYSGSLHLQGAAEMNVRMRLLDEAGKEVFARNLREIGPIWKKQGFGFTAGRTVENATFEVAVHAAGVYLFMMPALAVGVLTLCVKQTMPASLSNHERRTSPQHDRLAQPDAPYTNCGLPAGT